MDCGLGADRAGSSTPPMAGAPSLRAAEPVRLSAARRVEDVARAAQIVVLGGGERGGVGAAAGAVDAVDAVAAVVASWAPAAPHRSWRGLGLGLRRHRVRRVDADDGFVGDREDVGDGDPVADVHAAGADGAGLGTVSHGGETGTGAEASAELASSVCDSSGGGRAMRKCSRFASLTRWSSCSAIWKS